MLSCVHCNAETIRPEAAARYLGWRVFRGTTLTGKQLVDVLCPSCSGREFKGTRLKPLEGQLELALEQGEVVNGTG